MLQCTIMLMVLHVIMVTMPSTQLIHMALESESIIGYEKVKEERTTHMEDSWIISAIVLLITIEVVFIVACNDHALVHTPVLT